MGILIRGGKIGNPQGIVNADIVIDDGKVSVTNAKVDGMKDFIVIHSSHPFIMKNPYAIKQTIAFLRQGTFKRK